MSRSGRKCKSLCDHIGEPQLPVQISEKDACHENKSYSDLHDPKLSDLEDGVAFKTKDFSGLPSWERSKGSLRQMEDRRDLNDFPDARKAWDGDRSYHVSSAFDRLEPQNRTRSPENSRKLSSRSRSRDRDRGRSRSPSRGRGRSRDRDWDKGRCKGRSRSRSPLGNYREESYRRPDRRSGLGGLPSQPCREFASGKCRRGSECRFLHQDNLNNKDGGLSERERSERWRTAQECAGNGYDGEKDDHMRSSGKSTGLCNDFMKGRCHRGSFCRFSHDDAAAYNSERGSRDSSFDHNYKQQPRTIGNTPCKFFMMGSCNRDNCRFSHNVPGSGYTEGKSLNNIRSKDVDDPNNSWKGGPKWGEATAVSNVSQFTDRSNVEKKTFVDETNKPWNGRKWGEATTVPDVSQFTGWSNVEVDTFNDPPQAEKRTGDSRSNVGKGTFVDEMNKSWSGPKWGGATTVSNVSQFTGWNNVGKDTFVDEMNKPRSGPKWGEATTASDVSQFTGWSNVEEETFIDPAPAEKRTDGSRSNVGKGTFVNEMNKPRSGPKWGGATTVPNVSQFTGRNNVGNKTFVDEMKKPWNGPKWGEATTVPDVSQFTGWSNAEVETFIDPAPAKKQTDDSWSNVRKETSVDEMNKPWSGPKRGGETTVPDVSQFTGWSNVEVETFIHPSPAEKGTDDRRGNSLEDTNKSGLKWGGATGISEIAISSRCGNSSGENTDLADLAYAEKHPDVAKSIDSEYPPSNELDIDLNGPVRQDYSPSNLQNQSQIQHGESVQKIVNFTIPLNAVNNEQVGKITTFPSSLMQIIENGQLPQLYAALNPPNSIELVSPFPHSANLLPTVTVTNTQSVQASISQKQCNPIADSIKPTRNDATEQNSLMLLKRSSKQSTVGFDSVKLHKNDFPVDNSQRRPELRQQKIVADSGYEENRKSIAEKRKLEQENMRTENVDAIPRILDDNAEKDEKAMHLFKIALVEFVKEILKPKWKEGQMSREVHKSIVKKVVDKVTSIIQGDNVPKTQDNINQYLSYSKSKLTKLVEAYTEKFSKCP